MTPAPDAPASAKRKRGRPPSFDRAAALEAAMRVFWDRGYEGASFESLVAAMRISHWTFSHAFGGKAQLYREAVDHYLATVGDLFSPTLNGTDDTKAAFGALIRRAAAGMTREDFPTGCMVSLAGVNAAPEPDPARTLLREVRGRAVRLMRQRLEVGQARGDLPIDADLDELAAFFELVIRGMAVKARDGASSQDLEQVGLLAIRAWPD